MFGRIYASVYFMVVAELAMNKFWNKTSPRGFRLILSRGLLDIPALYVLEISLWQDETSYTAMQVTAPWFLGSKYQSITPIYQLITPATRSPVMRMRTGATNLVLENSVLSGCSVQIALAAMSAWWMLA